jgi:hypothetical protein
VTEICRCRTAALVKCQRKRLFIASFAQISLFFEVEQGETSSQETAWRTTPSTGFLASPYGKSGTLKASFG